MFQRFDQNNNTSNFIKSLLAQTDIPAIPFGKLPEGQYGLYIEEGYFYFKSKNKTLNYGPYIWGKKYEGLTTRYISNNSYYDSGTHYYLGEYLRALRGNFKIDLMPYYNCFNNSYAKDIYLDESLKIKVTSSNTGYQVMLVPIKFNQKYTIAIDCPSSISIQPLFYGNKGLAQSSYLTKINNNLIGLGIKKNNSNFREPILYDKLYNLKPNESTNLIPYERFLKLAIQIPTNTKYSIVVLEGDYTLSNSKVVSNLEYPGLKDEDLNKLLISPLSLLQLPTTYPIAFSDRLIEYLTQNVITPHDNIDENIERIQFYASSNINELKNGSKIPFNSYTKGIWDPTLRIYLYNLMKDTQYNKKMKLDYNGFVDKDTETIITRGQKV